MPSAISLLALRGAADIFVNQIDGDPDRNNGNCGFASGLMALRALGIPDPPPAPWAAGSDDYRKAMTLRELGGGGRSDAWGQCTEVRAGLEQVGARAEFVQRHWGDNTEQAVKLMRDELVEPSRDEVFVICGTSARAPRGHFVMVHGYDQRTQEFTVLDPGDHSPTRLRAAELANFLKGRNATDQDEVIRVTRRDR